MKRADIGEIGPDMVHSESTIFGPMEDLLKNPPKYFKQSLASLPSNPSAMVLVLANIFFILFAIITNVTLMEVFFVYWLQSLIIGFFTIIKVLTYPSAFDITQKDGSKVLREENLGLRGRIGISLFFIVHYGIFHLVYLMFIGIPDFSSAGYIATGALIFFLTHLVSFLMNFKQDTSKRYNTAELMFSAYPRIIPMHLGIMFGGFLSIIVGLPLLILFGETIAARGADIAAMSFFLILKTLLDVGAHNDSHDVVLEETVAVKK